MQIIYPEQKDKDLFDKFVNSSPMATCLQMWEAKEYRNKSKTIPYDRIAIQDNNQIVAAATFSVSKFKYLGNLIYIPHGPVWSGEEALFTLTNELINIAKNKNAFAIVAEPRIFQNSNENNELLRAGYKYTGKAVQPRHTVLIDLTRDSQDILNSFSKSTRYNIRLADKKGIQIRSYLNPSDSSQIDSFYKLLKETQDRKYFYVQDKSFYQYLWSEYSKNNHAALFEAYYQDELLNSLLLLYNDYRASSIYSASSRKYSNLKATYLLRWKSIEFAKENGCRLYDFFGAAKTEDTNHPFYYTTQFKLGFGREITEYAGTFEIILNPVKYNAWIYGAKFGFFKLYEDSFLKDLKNKSIG